MRIPDPELHARRRAEILQAAAQCFVARGFHAASMQDIAEQAGVSMGLLYRYFANKEAIITSFADLERDQMVAEIDAWAASADPLTDLPRLFRASVREAARPDDGRIVAEVYSEALRNAALRRILVDHEARIVRALAEAIGAHQRAGRLASAADAVAIAGLILCMVDGLSTRMLLRSKLSPRAIEDATIEALVTLLRPDGKRV